MSRVSPPAHGNRVSLYYGGINAEEYVSLSDALWSIIRCGPIMISSNGNGFCVNLGNALNKHLSCRWFETPYDAHVTTLYCIAVANQSNEALLCFTASIKWMPLLNPSEQHIISTYTAVLNAWCRVKMAAVFQTTFSNAISWMKMHEFVSNFHRTLFLRIKLTISQYWFR